MNIVRDMLKVAQSLLSFPTFTGLSHRYQQRKHLVFLLKKKVLISSLFFVLFNIYIYNYNSICDEILNFFFVNFRQVENNLELSIEIITAFSLIKIIKILFFQETNF